MIRRSSLVLTAAGLALGQLACTGAEVALEPATHEGVSLGVARSALSAGDAGATDAGSSTPPALPFALTPFAFTSTVSESGAFADGDVRLDGVEFESAEGEAVTLGRRDLQTVRSATILIDDGVDVERGGNNFASGQGINSALDDWTREGPATITPTSDDLAASLGNFNLTSIVVTREAVGTASLEVTFAKPSDTFFFWERGNATSPTTANSDLLVEALNGRGEVIAAHHLLRSEFAPTGIEITTWNGSFYSPSTPEGAFPQLGSIGLSLEVPVKTLRLTSIQQAEGGQRDDGPDYKVIAERRTHRHRGE